jgi:monoamine oxidase
MNDPKYLKYYSIEGGNEQLPRALADRLSGTVLLEHAVCRVERSADGTLSVRSRHGEQCRDDEFDFVVVALPHDALPSIDFAGERLRAAVDRHHAYYDHPAHYLRITLLFERPFWRGVLVDSYCMSDRMGGSCLYEESSREPEPRYGVLGWLVGGDAALSRSDRDDNALIAEALDSLPDSLAQGRDSFLEGRVHRWVGAVNAMPGGVEYRTLDQRHRPEGCDHPNLLVVGDYLFDSTLNGVFDSATYAADCLAAMMNDEAPSNPPRRPQ